MVKKPMMEQQWGMGRWNSPGNGVDTEWVCWLYEYDVPSSRREKGVTQTAEASSCFWKCTCNNIGLKWVNVSNRKFATHQFDTPK